MRKARLQYIIMIYAAGEIKSICTRESRNRAHTCAPGYYCRELTWKFTGQVCPLYISRSCMHRCGTITLELMLTEYCHSIVCPRDIRYFLVVILLSLCRFLRSRLFLNLFDRLFGIITVSVPYSCNFLL